MKERPIIFSGPMVRAILEGRKTQTRRLKGLDRINEFPDSHAVAHPDGGGNWVFWYPDSPGLAEKTKRLYPNGEGIPCPYGRPGDRLWVRETHYRWTGCGEAPSHWRRSPDGDRYQSRGYADDAEIGAIRLSAACVTVPPIHMPRWASRIMLEITGVRVERLQEITEEDAISEGAFVSPTGIIKPAGTLTHRNEFARLWQEINGKRAPWESNPWVWVIEFKRAEAR